MEKKPIVTEKRISPVRRSEGRLEKRETFKPTPVSVPKRELTPKTAPAKEEQTPPVREAAPVRTPVKTTFVKEPEEDIFSGEISDEPLTEEEMSFLSMSSTKKEASAKQEVLPVEKSEKVGDVIFKNIEKVYQEELKKQPPITVSEKIVIKPARYHEEIPVFVVEVEKHSTLFSEYSNELKKAIVWFDSITKLVSKNSLNKIFADLYPNGIPGSFLKTKTSLYVSSLVKPVPESFESAYLVVEVPNEKQDLFSEDLKEVEILRMFLVSTRAIFL